VGVHVFHGLREHLGGVLPLRRRGGVVPDQEDLVHPHVQRVRVEGVDDLVHERVDDPVDLRVHGVPLAAVDPLVLREGAGREVELRVLREERPRLLRPRLVAEALELGDHPDALLAARRHEATGPRAGDHLLGEPQLGVRAELEAVVDLEDQDVHAEGGEGGELALDQLEVGVVVVVDQVEGDPGGVGSGALVRGHRRKGDEQGEEHRESAHRRLRA
jgi:hypothetical protein